MRIFALLFFTFTLPLAVLTATVLYGGFSTTIVKTELAKSNIYTKTLEILREPSEGDQTYQEQQEDQVISALAVFVTPDYLQTKTETMIDDATVWITGQSTTPPVLSLKEIKDEIEMKNPGLLTNVQELSQAMQNQENTEQKQTVEKDMLTNFVKNDFSFPLEKNLQGAKETYDTLKLAFPALIAFLIVYLALLLLVNNTWKTRLRWVGITFLISGVWGYTVAIIFTSISQTLVGAVLENKDVLIQTIVPITKRIITPFGLQYVSYQTVVTIVLLGVGGICLAVSLLLKAPLVPVAPVKRLPKKKKSRL